MIHYALRCARGDEFDGWFAGSAAFDGQAEQGLVECPFCGSREVTRALMAPRLGKGSRELTAGPGAGVPPAATPPALPAPAGAAPALPSALRAALSRIREEVERTCTYVGPAFSDQAIRMHRGELDQTPIYGEATPEESERLEAEGVEFGRILWLPRSDA